VIDAAIIGGGPVGLFCALALANRGLSVTVLEQSDATRPETRSIGLHPPALERLAELGLVEVFLEHGVRVRRGLAIDGVGLVGVVDFADASRTFPFALSVPQPTTERLLRAAVDQRPVSMRRGARFTGLSRATDAIAVRYTEHGHDRELRARWLIGCDGRNSTVRTLLGIAFYPRQYRGSYLMADFPDDTGLGDDAAVFLTRDGLVESFPLPAAARRWVAQAPGRRDRIDPAELCALVEARTTHHLDPARAEHASAFGVEQGSAVTFRVGPVALIGDAAHVLSPFGGQGMNLGWLDAWSLAEALATDQADAALDRWHRARQRAARVAMRRAAFNTRMGRATRLAAARNAVLRIVLASPLRRPLTRRFGMHGLS
jgi:2-polyprenyl-6-methoxyphenol hydroxylase-like FAD-dependent oxidoreductase